MKRTLLAVLLVLIGVLAGAFSCWFYFADTMKRGLALGQDMFSSAMYNYESDEANRQYKNPNRDVAIYALNRALISMQKFPPPARLGCRHIAFNLAKLNVRLAHLYRDARDTASENVQLQFAMANYEKLGWKLANTAELEKALPLIEADKTAEAMTTIGRLEKPCE